MKATDAIATAFDHLALLPDQSVVIAPVDRVAALDLALQIDASTDALALRGMTFAVKDNIDVAGVPTTAACPSYAYVPDESATVVDRLVAAGAVPVAKTNLDQFATGLVGTRSPYGTAPNPFDAALVPGGSSSGSAVAVATGLVPFALGTDTAGSGRVPAAMCGIVGLKPTRGWLSTRGVVPAVRSIDCVSVFARTVELAWDVASAAGGHDPADPMSRPAAPTSRAVARSAGVLSAGALTDLGVDDEVAAGYLAAVDLLRGSGMPVTDVDITPLLAIGDLLYGGPWVAERFAAVGDVVTGDVDGLDPVVRAIISESADWSAVDAYTARYTLAALSAEVAALFDAVDVLVTPTIPTLATVEDVRAEPRSVNTRLGRFTTFSNLADLCALTLPVGAPRDGGRRPPTSVTLHGPAWADEMLVRTAALLGHETSSADVPRGWISLAVAGAHLAGQPLEWQLVDRRAVWLGTTTTSSDYRLCAVKDTVPPKPGLWRVEADGTAIEVDVWALAPAAFGDFVAQVPAPLCIGSVELADGRRVSGFLCEPAAVASGRDITEFGGWRAYLASL